MSGASLNTEREGHVVVEGELSFDTVAALFKNSKSLFSGASSLNFNLSSVTRADSAGVALMVEWLRAARQHQVDIQFTKVPKQMLSMIEVWGLVEILPISGS